MKCCVSTPLAAFLSPWSGQRTCRAGRWLATAALALAWSGPAQAADPARGARLFAGPPAPGLLGCADCHSDNPVVNNFGNIWAGRNAVALIDRAIQSNTGGMGYLRNYRSAADIADIAAYLGNAPASVVFPSTPVGARSSLRRVTVSTSTKAGAGAFSARVEGDFEIVASDCGVERPRFSSCSIDLAFAPAVAGERLGTLVMNHDATPTPVRLALAGVAPERPPAVARVTPQAIHFGSSPQGLASRPRNLTLFNDSDEPLTVGELSADGGFAVVGGNCTTGTVLARSERCTVSLHHEALAAGPANGRLELRHDGAGGSAVVELTGRAESAAAARLQADVDGVDFGATSPGGTTLRTQLQLHNVGTADWTALELGAPGSGFAAEATACRAALPLRPGQRCELPVSFTPPRRGRFSATLRIGGAGLDAAIELPLQGRGLEEGSSPLQADHGRLLFDAVVGRSQQQQVTLANAGPAASTLQFLRLDGLHASDFTIDTASGSCGASLPAGASCRIALRFTPGAAGVRHARLQLAAAGEATPAVIELAGRATAAPVPRLSVDAVVLDFASVPSGAPVAASQRLTVRNTGTLDARWARIRTVGDHAGEFLLSGACRDNASLPAGAACQLDLAFAPAAPGQRRASLLLQAEGGEPLAVSLTGGTAAVATAPPARQRSLASAALVVVPDHLVFQVDPANAGQPQTQTVRWRNDGPAVLRIDAFELQGAGFETALSGTSADPCPQPPFDLLPGEACSLRLSWYGSSAGAAGGRLSARADDPWGGARVDLAVSEDPAQRSNVGSGGGAPGALGWWLALSLATAMLAFNGRASRRNRPRRGRSRP